MSVRFRSVPIVFKTTNTKIDKLYSNWIKYKGTSKTKRIVWAFVGGFLLLIGAIMAGGCTSGHVISGGIQLALSSFVFVFFTFVGLLITGKFFYNNKERKR